MMKRYLAWGWTLIVIAAVVLLGAACGQEVLPSAAPTTAAPTTAAPTNEATPLPTEPPSAIDDASRDAEPADDEPGADESADAASPVEGSADQAPTTDSWLPETEDNWEDVTANLEGLDSTCGNVPYVSSNPARDQVIAAVSTHGLFEFDNESVSWTPLGSGPGSAFINNRMGWIEYDPVVPERFWQAGPYGHGLFRTDDNGVTFSRLGELTHLDFVSVDLTDPMRAVMMVGVHEDSVIYRSQDAGVTWQDLSAGLPSGIGFTPYPVVFDPSTHLLGTYRSNAAGVFHSADAGATWTRTYDVAVSGPPVVSGDNVFWLLQNGAGVIRSSNQGFSFERGERTGGRPATLTRLSDERLVTHNDQRLLISSDSGASWTPYGPPLPYKPTGLAVSEDGGSVFVWRFTCNFDERGNPVLPMSIMRIGADFEQS